MKNIISFDDFEEAFIERAKAVGIRLMHFKDVIAEGRSNQAKVEFEKATPETIYIICYTSGTTGDPKGSLVPHSYFISLMHALDYVKTGLNKDDIALSYLPFAHMFEQGMWIFTIFLGMKSGFY